MTIRPLNAALMAASFNVALMLEELISVVDWQVFGIQLPGFQDKEYELEKIRADRHSVEQCKLELFGTWRKIYPQASWSDICVALKKVGMPTLARTLEAKYVIVASAAERGSVQEKVEVIEHAAQVPEESSAVAITTRVIEVKKEIVVEHTMQELMEEFSDLMEMCLQQIERGSLQGILKFVEEAASAAGLVHTVCPFPATAVEDILPRLDPCFDFLDPGIIQKLLEMFAFTKFSTTSFARYAEKVKQFRSTATIELLMASTQPSPIELKVAESTIMILKLEAKWMDVVIDGLYKLLGVVLPPTMKIQSLMKRASFKPASTTIEYIVPEGEVDAIAQNIADKQSFLTLFGVCQLYIGDYCAINEDENPDFSFESLLIDFSKVADAENVVLFLLKLGTNIDCHNDKGITPLMYASACGHVSVLCTLILEGAKVDLHISGDGITALILAAQNGSVGCIMQLLEAGSNIDQQYTKYGSTPLIMAVKNGHNDAAETLLVKGANPNLHTITGWTPLMYASQDGYERLVSLLLQNGADPNIQSIDQACTALMAASQNGHIEVTKLLLDNEFEVSDPNLQTNSGSTALMFATSNGYEIIAALLLHHNANPDILNNDGIGALRFAFGSDNPEIATLLLDAKADIDTKDKFKLTPLMITGLRKEIQYMELLIGKGAGLNEQDEDGETVLYHACARGFFEVAMLLLENKADPNIPSYKGLTSLMSASMNGHLEIVELLISLDFVKINCCAFNDGLTALMLAIHSSQQALAIVRELLQHDADPNIPAEDGVTALMASLYHDPQIAQELLKHGAKLDLQDKNGRTALMYACQNGLHTMVRLLLEKFADLQIECSKGLTAIKYACVNGHFAEENRGNFVEVIKLLTLYGAVDCDELKPLYMSCTMGDLDFVEVMLDQEPKIETLLHGFNISCYHGHSKVAFFFLSKIRGIDESAFQVAKACSEGNIEAITSMIADSRVDVCVALDITPLMLASSFGHQEVARQLAEAECGKYVNYIDKDGYTALDYANNCYQKDIASMLKRNGALSRSELPAEEEVTSTQRPAAQVPDTTTEADEPKHEDKRPSLLHSALNHAKDFFEEALHKIKN